MNKNKKTCAYVGGPNNTQGYAIFDYYEGSPTYRYEDKERLTELYIYEEWAWRQYREHKKQRIEDEYFEKNNKVD